MVRGHRAATLEQVARLAGVSISTASMALNQRPGVKETTRQRVLAAAESLDYQPNSLAQSLLTNATHTVGLLIPNISEPFYGELLRGIDKVASEHDYTPVLMNTDRDPEQEVRCIQALRRRRVDGLIFLGSGLAGDRHLLSAVDLTGLPIIRIGRHDLPFPCIRADDTAGAFMAIQHLLERGRRAIGFLHGPLSSATSRDRLSSYRLALQTNRVAPRPEWAVEADYSVGGGYQAAHRLLEHTKVDALFCVSDQIAIGAMAALRERSLRIPEDVSVVGFNGMEESRYTAPPLTTVAVPIRQMGEQAMEMMLQSLQGETVETRILPVDLVVRGSS